MYIRCVQCKALTQVTMPAASSGPTTVSCSGCNRRYRLAVARPQASGDQERYRKAKAFAETNQIDLASAYSVLEGVMSLEDAAASRGQKAPGRAPATGANPAPPLATPSMHAAPATLPSATPTVRTSTPPAAAHPGKATGPVLWEDEAPYDPGFKTAVREGCLTAAQALERGDRRSLALRIAQRHRLSMELAMKVADNRITVRQALDQKAAHESKEPPRAQTSVSHGVWNFMVLSVGLLILGALGVHVYSVWSDYLARNGAAGFEEVASAAERPRPPEPPPQEVPMPPPALTVPKTDTAGQLIQVEGPDPRSVLISFCVTGRQAGRRDPIEILPGVPPSSSLRFGTFRSLDQEGTPIRAIRIRLDPRSGRWQTGDGRSPIATEPPPPHIPGGHGDPVTLTENRPGA